MLGLIVSNKVLQEFQSPKVSLLLAWWSARCKCAPESSVFRFITPDPNYGSLPWEPDPRTRRCHRGVSWGADMFIGRQVTVVYPQMPPCHVRPPSYTTVTVYFLSVFLYICLSPGSSWIHMVLGPWRKSVLSRSKSDFSARLPEQNDAVVAGVEEEESFNICIDL